VLGGIHSHLDGHVNPFAVTLGYARAAQRLGVRIIEGSEVTAIDVQFGRVQAVRHQEGRILTRTVVNAAGSWSPDVGEMVGIRVPVLPCRGQVLITPRIRRYRGHIIMGVEPGARQEVAGGVIVGSTKQFVGFNDGVDYRTLTEFARGAVLHFPFLRGLSALRAWAGLRPASPDDIPILGPVGEPEGYFLATGHFRTGVATAPPPGESWPR
jgi:glycine/D-amino acid oxidase-like deaminating enzyme